MNRLHFFLSGMPVVTSYMTLTNRITAKKELIDTISWTSEVLTLMFCWVWCGIIIYHNDIYDITGDFVRGDFVENRFTVWPGLVGSPGSCFFVMLACLALVNARGLVGAILLGKNSLIQPLSQGWQGVIHRNLQKSSLWGDSLQVSPVNIFHVLHRLYVWFFVALEIFIILM